jgi:hypothetical protein
MQRFSHRRVIVDHVNNGFLVRGERHRWVSMSELWACIKRKCDGAYSIAQLGTRLHRASDRGDGANNDLRYLSGIYS